MTTLAFGLVFLSAFCHAFWNFLSKRQNPGATFFLMTCLTSSILLLPLLFILREGLAAIPLAVWGLLAATGATQALYFIFLGATYRNGDLSHGYPLARSLPVLLVALASVVLGRGGQISTLAYPGFALVAAGCLLLPLPRFRDFHPGSYRARWVLFAVLTAVCITGYTLIDDQAMRILRSNQDVAFSNLEWTLLYAEMEGISIMVFLGAAALLSKTERSKLKGASLTEWWRAARVGLIITFAYGLVLLAMGYVRDVSYVSAFRQLSIPIGAALGILVRKEPAYPPKLAGIGLVVTGLVLAAFP